jgi:hypothetical protein
MACEAPPPQHFNLCNFFRRGGRGRVAGIYRRRFGLSRPACKGSCVDVYTDFHFSLGKFLAAPPSLQIGRRSLVWAADLPVCESQILFPTLLPAPSGRQRRALIACRSSSRGCRYGLPDRPRGRRVDGHRLAQRTDDCEVGRPLRTVQRALAKAQQLSLIKVTRRFDTSNVYSINWAPFLNALDRVEHRRNKVTTRPKVSSLPPRRYQNDVTAIRRPKVALLTLPPEVAAPRRTNSLTEVSHTNSLSELTCATASPLLMKRGSAILTTS